MLCSEEISKFKGVHEFNGGLGNIYGVGISGLGVFSLGKDLLSSLLGFSLKGIILSDSFLEGFSALG